MAKKKRKRRRRRRFLLQYVVLAVLAALVAGAGFGLWRRPPPTPKAGWQPEAPTTAATTSQPTQASTTRKATTTPTTRPKKVEVVPAKLHHPFAEVAAILDPGHLKVDPLPAVPTDVLEEFADDGRDNRLRLAVRDAVQRLQQLGPLTIGNRLAAADRRGLLAVVEKAQKQAGADQLRLEALLDELRGLARDRDEESRRWQANYDFVTARVLAHLVQRQELSVQLGGLRKQLAGTEAVPAGGWLLVSDPELILHELAPLVQERLALLKRLGKEQADNPWRAVAERELTIPLSLRARPVKK